MTGRLWTDAEVSYLCALSWDAGRYQERHRIAEAYAELEVRWRPVGRKSYEARVRERLAEMEQHAARINAKLGRPAGYVYRGGALDWKTGQPVRQLEKAA